MVLVVVLVDEIRKPSNVDKDGTVVQWVELPANYSRSLKEVKCEKLDVLSLCIFSFILY